jgi:hypothetical protein
VPGALCIRHNRATIFEHLNPLIHDSTREWAHTRRWICAPGTPSAHKMRMTDRCSSLVQFISFAAIFTQRDNSRTKLQGQPACPTH